MLNDFYTINALEQDGNVLQCCLSFNAGHKIFSGHFPSQPVVPGVCTMHIVKALLEAALGERLVLKESSAIKFLRLMTPDSAPAVSISWERAEKGITASATFKDGEAAVFKMNGFYISFGAAAG